MPNHSNLQGLSPEFVSPGKLWRQFRRFCSSCNTLKDSFRMSTSTAQSLPEFTPRKDLIERSSDFLNPILVKEIRQSLKSRGFVSVFLLMLIASWLISAVGVLYVYGPELPYAAAGRTFFTAFYMVLAIAVFIVVPQSAFRSIQAERDLHTFEMLTITTLSPRKIVWGKWWSATVQAIVYYAAIAPFMAFTNLLRGISLTLIIFVLVWSFITSISLSMLAIAFSTFTKQRQAFGILQFVLVFPLISILMSLLTMMNVFITTEPPFDEPSFWLFQLLILSFLIPTFVLLRQIATANLTFEGANRSTGIRWSCLTLLLAALGWMSVLIAPGYLSITALSGFTPPADTVLFWITCLSIWLWLVGLFASTEDDRLSRRVRQEAPRSTLFRFLLIPFYPGGGRGFIYFLLSVVAMGVVGMWLVRLTSSTPDVQIRASDTIFAMTCYLLFYIGLTSFFGRGLRRIGTDLHAAHARVLGILILATGIIAPVLLSIYDLNWSDDYPILQTTNPGQVLYRMFNGGTYPPMPVIVVLAAVGIMLNVRSMIRGISEMMSINKPTANATSPTPST